MKYKILRRDSTLEMMNDVQAELDKGWDLYGDLIVHFNSTGQPTYIRELVKYEDAEGAAWELLATSVAKQYEAMASES